MTTISIFFINVILLIMATPYLISLLMKLNSVDIPNTKKIHTAVTRDRRNNYLYFTAALNLFY